MWMLQVTRGGGILHKSLRFIAVDSKSPDLPVRDVSYIVSTISHAENIEAVVELMRFEALIIGYLAKQLRSAVVGMLVQSPWLHDIAPFHAFAGFKSGTLAAMRVAGGILTIKHRNT